jgi:hypothetical protein
MHQSERAIVTTWYRKGNRMLTSHVLDLCAARAAGHYTPIDPRLHLARAAEGSRLAMSRTECVNSGAHPYLWTDTSETYTEAIQLVKLRLGCATLLQDNTPVSMRNLRAVSLHCSRTD